MFFTSLVFTLIGHVTVFNPTDTCCFHVPFDFSGAPHARVGGAPWLSKSTHPRKFGNHVTVHRPPTDRPSAPQENQCLLSHIYLVWEPKRKLIVHQCCDQLTAIKTGHPLTSIT